MAMRVVISKISMACVLLIIIVAVIVRESNARGLTKMFTEAVMCETDDELQDLCQRCAKLTKSKIALQTCCSKTDLMARKFCFDYVYFGRGQYDFY